MVLYFWSCKLGRLGIVFKRVVVGMMLLGIVQNANESRAVLLLN